MTCGEVIPITVVDLITIVVLILVVVPPSSSLLLVVGTPISTITTLAFTTPVMASKIILPVTVLVVATTFVEPSIGLIVFEVGAVVLVLLVAGFSTPSIVLLGLVVV